jgi:hypothetical protein
MPRDTYQDDSDTKDTAPIEIVENVAETFKALDLLAEISKIDAKMDCTEINSTSGMIDLQVLQNPVVPAILAESKLEVIKEWRIGSTHIKNPA